MKFVTLSIVVASALLLMPAPHRPRKRRAFRRTQISAGAELFAVNCAPCHGARMMDPGRGLQPAQVSARPKERFVNSVTKGKNQMPPWGDFFKPNQIDELWAYVMAGER